MARNEVTVAGPVAPKAGIQPSTIAAASINCVQRVHRVHRICRVLGILRIVENNLFGTEL